MVKYDEKNKCYYIDNKIKRRDGSFYHYTYHDNNNPLMKKKKYVQSIELEVEEQKRREMEYKRVGMRGSSIQCLCDNYIETKESELSSNTIYAYQAVIKNDLPKVFDMSKAPIDEFTPAKCQKYRIKIGSQSTTAKRKNVKIYVLTEIIMLARKLKLIDSELKDDCLFNLEKFKGDIKKKKECNKYTPLANLSKILNCVHNQNDHDMLQLLYFSGLRIGEFLGVKVKYVHFLDNLVQVDIEGQRLDGGEYTTRLKNNSSYKKIYYANENITVIKNFIERNKLSPEDYLMPYSRTSIRRILSKACKEAKIEYNTLHGFGRKSINTELYFATGGDVKVCQMALGQASSEINLEHYVSNEEATKKVIATIKKLDF